MTHAAHIATDLPTYTTELCRRDVLPVLATEYMPQEPPSKLATIGRHVDGKIISYQKRTRRGEAPQQPEWWHRVQWWLAAVRRIERENAAKLSALMMYIRYCEDAGDDDAAGQLREFLAEAWRWEGETPATRDDAERIAARHVRRSDVMSDAIFYGPR